MTDVSKTLSEREKNYGSFKEVARITQSILRIAESGARWRAMSDDKREAIHMLASKVARIVNGNPSHIDSWHDIGGYSSLIETDLLDVEAVIKECAGPLPCAQQ